MRISNRQIKKIIQEEIRKVLNEVECPAGSFRKAGKCVDAVTRDEVAPLDPQSVEAESDVADREYVASLVQYCKSHPGKTVTGEMLVFGGNVKCAADGSGNYKKLKPEPEPAGGQSVDMPTVTVPGKCPSTHPHNIRSNADGSTTCSRKDPLAKPPKPKKTYKYSKKIEMMQKMMSGHPEIGSKLKRIMGTTDGKLGPRTQKAVNYLRRHYRKKGVKVARGINNVVDFLADEKSGARENPEARKAALGFKRGELAKKWEKHVDNINNMKPENLKKYLAGKPKKYLSTVTTIARRKGYKDVALVADTLAA